jgi:DNA-binding GntR family transcriptional regulator
VARAAHSPIVQATIELLIQPPNDPFMTILDIITIESGAQFAFADEHNLVAEAILARDPIAAEQAMRRHVDALIDVVQRYLVRSLEDEPQSR